jgi:hypothetical protein
LLIYDWRFGPFLVVGTELALTSTEAQSSVSNYQLAVINSQARQPRVPCPELTAIPFAKISCFCQD